jgi:hypothetical protein
VLFCVLCLFVVPLPPGENPFAVKYNYIKYITTPIRISMYPMLMHIVVRTKMCVLLGLPFLPENESLTLSQSILWRM